MAPDDDFRRRPSNLKRQLPILMEACWIVIIYVICILYIHNKVITWSYRLYPSLGTTLSNCA